MKLVENDHTLVSSGTDGGMTFGIRDQDMGVILGILRNKLYSVPIGSLCREVLSNSADSHVAANKEDIPIRVELPTALCAEYRVIDYGTGMSPETVDTIFKNYGASTKRGDDSQKGGFGLGSKSPWAYSDSFTIQTIWDGIEYTYSAFIDESDRGKIFLMNEQETDKCNGTTYIVPVQRKDFDTFANRTYFYTTYFNPRPVIIGNTNDGWPTRENLVEGTNWNIGNWGHTRSNYWSSNASLVVGGIPYDIERHLIKDISTNHKELLNTRGLVIHAGIGDVHLSASRESLHYDDATINYIKTRLAQVVEELPSLITKLLEQAPTLWDASLRVKELNSRLNSSLCHGTWKGKPIPTRFEVPKEVKVSSYDPRVTKRRTIDGAIYPNRESILVYNDLSHINRLERIDIIKGNNPNKTILVMSVPKGYVLTDKEFPLTDLGVTYLSSIPYTPPTKVKIVQTGTTQKVVNRKPKGSVEAYLYRLTSNSSIPAIGDKTKGMFSFFNSLFLDLDQVNGGVYVSIKGGQLGSELGSEKLSQYINPYDCPSYLTELLDLLGITNLYAFSPANCLLLDTSWVTLDSMVTKYLLDNRSSLAMKSFLNRSDTYSENLPSMDSCLMKLPADHLLNRYFYKSIEFDQRQPGIDKQVALFRKHYKTIETLEIVDTTLKELYCEICDLYPLFIGMVRECYKGAFQQRHGEYIIDYINLVDNRNKYEKI